MHPGEQAFNDKRRDCMMYFLPFFILDLGYVACSVMWISNV